MIKKVYFDSASIMWMCVYSCCPCRLIEVLMTIIIFRLRDYEPCQGTKKAMVIFACYLHWVHWSLSHIEKEPLLQGTNIINIIIISSSSIRR